MVAPAVENRSAPGGVFAAAALDAGSKGIGWRHDSELTGQVGAHEVYPFELW